MGLAFDERQDKELPGLVAGSESRPSRRRGWSGMDPGTTAPTPGMATVRAVATPGGHGHGGGY